MSTIMLLDGSFVTCPKTCLYFGARFTAVLLFFDFFCQEGKSYEIVIGVTFVYRLLHESSDMFAIPDR